MTSPINGKKLKITSLGYCYCIVDRHTINLQISSMSFLKQKLNQ